MKSRIEKLITFLRKQKDTYGEQIFFCMNNAGDRLERIYDKDGLTVEHGDYYEIFGTLYSDRELLRAKLGKTFKIDTEDGVDDELNFPNRCTNYEAVTVKDLKEILDKHEDWEMLICHEGELDIISSDVRGVPIGNGEHEFPACKWLGFKAKIKIRNTGVSLTELWANKKQHL